MSDQVKTLSLIETEKLRNFQESLRALYDISEKYDSLSREFEKAKETLCPSCEQKRFPPDKNEIGGTKNHYELITPQNVTAQNEQNSSEVQKMITEQNSKLTPNPDNLLNDEWYQVL